MGGGKEFLKKQKCVFPWPPAESCLLLGMWLHRFWLVFLLKGTGRLFGIQATWRARNLVKQPYWQRWKHLSVPGSSHPHCSLHTWAFAVLPNVKLSRWGKKKETLWGARTSGRQELRVRTVPFKNNHSLPSYCAALCVGRAFQGVTLWIFVASGECPTPAPRKSVIESMCL